MAERSREEEIILFEDEEFSPGFNWKTIWGALFVGFIMLPGAIYMGLVTGQGFAGASQWVTIILFIEIAKRSFVQMKKQEVIILYWVAGGLVAMGARLGSAVALFGGPFGGFIWDQWLVQSPQAEGFGISHLIPHWFVPPKGSEALQQQSFFHSAWLLPIIILTIHSILASISRLSCGYFLYRVTNDIERLPFPMAPVAAGGAVALAETSAKKETWRWQVFSTGTVIGVIFSLIYVFIPVITGAFLPRPVQLIPIPFIDITSKLGGILPASALGLWTGFGRVLMGFVLPFWVVTGLFIGSAARQLVLNPILYKAGVLTHWQQGMTVRPTVVANNLDFWISYTIGAAVIIALLGITNVILAFVRRGRGLEAAEEITPRSPKLARRGDISIKLTLGIFALAMAGYVILCHKLVPLFPIGILIFFAFVWTPLTSYISARMLGITGSPRGASFPFLREGTFILSGYKGVDIWFAPVPLFNFGGVAQIFKQLELTRTKFVSYVKMTFAVLVIIMLCSFIFWSLIWKLSPIPSAAYPFVQKMWPFYATMQALWASSTLGEGKSFLLEGIKLKYIIGSSGVTAGLYALVSILGLPISFFYGLATGPGVWVHQTLPTMLGALLSRYYFVKRYGKTRWRAYAPVLLAGYGCGMGLVAMVGIGFALIAKSVSQIVY